jgi:hypothetical protein
VHGRGLEVRCCVPRLRVYCVCRLHRHRQQDAGLAYYLGTQTPLGAGKEVRYRHAYQRYFCISVWSFSRDTSTLTSQHVDVCSPLFSAPSACANTTRRFASHHIPLTDILHVSSLGRMPVSSPPLPSPPPLRYGQKQGKHPAATTSPVQLVRSIAMGCHSCYISNKHHPMRRR